MADLQQLFGIAGFDTNSVEPQGDFPVIPPGNYPVMVEKAEVKQTKSGTGHYLELALSILDGPCKNRKVWDRINIQNPSQQCVEIGLRSLAALGQALGLTSISATEQILNRVCIAHVKVKDEQNEVRTYSALPGQQPSAVQNSHIAPPQSPTGYCAPAAPPVQQGGPVANQATSSGKPPWAR